MSKTKQLFFGIILVLCATLVNAQIKTIKGFVRANSDVEGIHIINKTSEKYATTNEFGIFIVEGKIQDTLQVLSLKYQLKEIIISPTDIEKQQIIVNLDERINELEEVFITNYLGDLEFDIKTSEAKRDINFYDLGIPGYTGPKLTQAEQRLHDADHGTIYTGLGVNFHKLLNRISGRTKRLKGLVDLERRSGLLKKIEFELSETFFQHHELDEKHQKDFLYSLTDQPDFLERCRGKNNLEILHYLDEKLKTYKEQLASNQTQN